MSEGTRKMHWYAAYTKINQELTIKKRLDHLAIENYLDPSFDFYSDGSNNSFLVT